jgi:hypothetical protein
MNNDIHYKENIVEEEFIPVKSKPDELEAPSEYGKLKISYIDQLSEKDKSNLEEDCITIVSGNTSLNELTAIIRITITREYIFDKDSPNHPYPVATKPSKKVRFLYPWPILVVTGKEPISKILTLCGAFKTGAAAKSAGYLKPIPLGYSEIQVGKASGIYGFTKRKFRFYRT